MIFTKKKALRKGLEVENLNKIRRLRTLQILQRVCPNPIGEQSLMLNLKADPELDPDIDLVRQSLEYLDSVGFVDLVTVDDSPWLAASLSDVGLLFLEDKSIEFIGVDDDVIEVYRPADKPRYAPSNYRGSVSSIQMLPIEVRAWLDSELIRLNYTSYKQLAKNLREQGYEISKSAMGRYGKQQKDQQKSLRDSIQQAKMLADEVGGDGAAMNQALTALAQDKLMRIIGNEAYDKEIKLPDLVRSISALNRSDINTRNFKIKEEARKKALKEASEVASSKAIEMGMNKAGAEWVRSAVLGL